MVHKFWEVRNALEPGVGDLLIYGVIGGFFGDVTPTEFREDLESLGNVSELRVFINSPGGDVFAGQAIHSILKRHSASITIYVDGLAASIAAVIAMAGDRVIMPRNAMMMIHNPFTFGLGDSEEFREIADTLDKIRESIIPVFTSKTGMDREEIISLLDAETWMTAGEAVRMGFADEIEEAKQVAASMSGPGKLVVNGMTVDLDRYQNPPKMALGVDTTMSPSYSKQGETVLEAVSEYEQRTLGRLAARESSGRDLSNQDVGRWQHIKDAANRVLGVVAASPDPAPLSINQAQANQVAIEKERLRAIMNGVAA